MTETNGGLACTTRTFTTNYELIVYSNSNRKQKVTLKTGIYKYIEKTDEHSHISGVAPLKVDRKIYQTGDSC